MKKLTAETYEKRGHVAYVTLDRPSVLNALDLRTHEELAGLTREFWSLFLAQGSHTSS